MRGELPEIAESAWGNARNFGAVRGGGAETKNEELNGATRASGSGDAAEAVAPGKSAGGAGNARAAASGAAAATA